jgi:hypothetical protein
VKGDLGVEGLRVSISEFGVRNAEIRKMEKVIEELRDSDDLFSYVEIEIGKGTIE